MVKTHRSKRAHMSNRPKRTGFWPNNSIMNIAIAYVGPRQVGTDYFRATRCRNLLELMHDVQTHLSDTILRDVLYFRNAHPELSATVIVLSDLRVALNLYLMMIFDSLTSVANVPFRFLTIVISMGKWQIKLRCEGISTSGESLIARGT